MFAAANAAIVPGKMTDTVAGLASTVATRTLGTKSRACSAAAMTYCCCEIFPRPPAKGCRQAKMHRARTDARPIGGALAAALVADDVLLHRPAIVHLADILQEHRLPVNVFDRNVIEVGDAQRHRIGAHRVL